MSHFTKLDRAQIVDPEAFVKACADLGLTEVTRNTTIKDYAGKSINVDLAVKAGRYDVALQKNSESGKYDMVSDWWGVRGHLATNGDKDVCRSIKTDSDLQDFLLRHTTKHTIVSRYKRQGFRATVSEDADQNLTVKLQRAE